MKRNTFIRVLSALMAASVLFATAGCGNKKAPVQELSQPKIENNTAVLEYTTINEKGEEKNITTVVNVNVPDINKPITGMNLAQKFEKDSEKERFEYNKENFGLNDKEYNEIINNAEKWTTFNYVFYVANSSSKRILFRKISHTDADGIILDSDLGCEYGIPSGEGMSIVFDGIVDNTKYDSEDALMQALSKMNIGIIYTSANSIDDSVDDWGSVETKTMSVNFS